MQLSSYIAAEHPEVTVVCMHPGIVLTNIIETAFSAFKDIALDSECLGQFGDGYARETY
jgi:NAD(P)-dependent dehydrogenase (short-subunit alcohol dehydrogenase family)